MSNLICIFTRKHLDSDLCEIRAATPPKKKEKKNKNTAKDLEQERREGNERVLRSYRIK